MSHRANMLPRTLLARTFLLVAVLMLLSVLAWFALYSLYEREPRARQLSQLMASVVNVTRSALVNAHPDKRHDLLRDLSAQEGVRVYLSEPGETIQPLPDREVLRMVGERLRAVLGPETRFTLGRNGEQAVFVSFRIDDDEYWVALPRERIERPFPWQWAGWGIAALLLSLGGAWLIVFRVIRPLKALALAAGEIGQGRRPPRVDEGGPEEIETLTRTFNQMGADLARLDQDRALILAGISHDLRTPLTRLRMGIELSPGDEDSRASMVADIEEMDRTIGQFLDFARTDGGEAPQDTDLGALLVEIVEKYRRLGFALETDIPASLGATVRPKALRRAVSNLIDNARHHAADGPVRLALGREGTETAIEVADRGPGIPEGETERMKRPFTRIDDARSGAMGAGLGLAIVDRIAQAHGGRLELARRDGGGLAARIVLPAGTQND